MQNANATNALGRPIRIVAIYLKIFSVFTILIGIPLCYFYSGYQMITLGVFTFMRGNKISRDSGRYAERGLDIAGSIVGEVFVAASNEGTGGRRWFGPAIPYTPQQEHAG